MAMSSDGNLVIQGMPSPTSAAAVTAAAASSAMATEGAGCAASPPAHRVMTALEKAPAWALAAGSLLFVVAVAVLDHFVADHIPVLVLYAPVVALACWIMGLRAAVAVAMFCSVLWLLDDLMFLPRPEVQFGKCWVTVVHVAFFVIVSTVLSRLHVAYERERTASMTDRLTGLANCRAFMDRADREIEQCGRAGQPISLAVIDCDNFKAVNDTVGHLAGDRLLEIIGRAMREGVRPADLVARVGGDEFAILMPRASREEARAVIECVQAHVNDTVRRQGWPVTLSIGTVTFAHTPGSVTAMIREADHLMYAVKHEHKDAARYGLVG
jgi:diguanylate cyclase (GGDEF)-like protein